MEAAELACAQDEALCDVPPIGRRWIVEHVPIEDELHVTIHTNTLDGTKLVIDPRVGPSPDSGAVDALLAAPCYEYPWVKTWNHSQDRIEFIHEESGTTESSEERVKMITALSKADEPHEPWVKMYSAVRNTVLYHNVETRNIVETLERARIEDRLDGYPEPPPPWNKEWDTELGGVVYCRSSTASRAINLCEIKTEDRKLAAAPAVSEPWYPRYDKASDRTWFLNVKTGVKASTLIDIRKADLLESCPDPPAPWIKEVGESWYSGNTDSSLLDDTDENQSNEAAKKNLMTWYKHPIRGTKALDLADIHALDAVEHAPDAGPRWTKQWDPLTKSVQYSKIGGVKIVFSIEEAAIHDKLELAPSVGHGWEKAWDTKQSKIYYFHKPSQKSVWSFTEAKMLAELSEAEDPAPNSPWMKFWSPQHKSVWYRHSLDPSRVIASLSLAMASDTLESAPVVMGWSKFWSESDRMVLYRNMSSGAVARSFREACISIAPEPLSPDWQKLWSTDTESVVYNHSNGSVANYQQMRMQVAFSRSPDPGEGWTKLWDATSGSVVYQNNHTKAIVYTISDVTRCNAFAHAPVPGDGWGTGYDPDTNQLYFMHVETQTRAGTIEEVHAINERYASKTNAPCKT